MINAEDEPDEDLRKAISRNETRAEWGGLAVVFGLAVEVGITAEYRHGASFIERWGPVFADALITIGVAAEILFARKARSRAETLQRRSDESVAEANARAAEANQKAQEASLELAKFREPRRLDAEQAKRVQGKLSAWKGMVFDSAVSSADREIEELRAVICLSLSKAGWTEIDWLAEAYAVRREDGKYLSVGHGLLVSDVLIGVNEDDRLNPAGKAAETLEPVRN